MHLVADLVLVTHEADDHSAADQIFGNPLIFRSVMAVGFNRANGIPFYGVALQKDPIGHGGANTAFTISFDGVKFCYLGQIAMPLLAQEKEELGHVDVLFLPVGLQTLSVAELNEVAKDLGAKIIVPVNYKTDLSGELPLRSLDDYLVGDEASCAQNRFRRDRGDSRLASSRSHALSSQVAMKILLIGSGGREHALAWRFCQDDPGLKLFTAPGNAGTAELGTNLPIGVNDLDGSR